MLRRTWLGLVSLGALAGCGSAEAPVELPAPPAGGAPAQELPLAGAPTQELPLAGAPGQELPVAGAPNEGEVGACQAGAARFEGPQTLMVAGKERQYLVQLPADYDPSRRYPVLFGLHGAGGSGPSYVNAFPLRALWQDRAILVFPSALFYEVDGRTTWRHPTDENLAFFDAMVAELDTKLCVDRARIFASGFSSGGFFSNTLGCRRGDVVRAIVPVAGGDRDFNDSCAGHVAVLVISSPLDSSDPTGGPAGISHHERGLQARDYFRERNGCSDVFEPMGPSGCGQYKDCKAGAEVSYCEHGLGHAWPSELHATASEFLASY
jgi:poly(3-hydroxybutyrate) depolymerase